MHFTNIFIKNFQLKYLIGKNKKNAAIIRFYFCADNFYIEVLLTYAVSW
jgi:hypothetical protein